MANHRKLNAAQERRVATLYRDDKQSIMYIANELRVSDDVVLGALKRAGVELRPKGKGGLRSTSRAKADAAVELYAEGKGCEEVALAYGVTSGTVLRWVREAGIEVRPAGFQKGEAHHDWKGGRIQNADGYILVLQHPEDPFYSMANIKTGGSRYVLEHRLVMAQKLGRCLTEVETVHHKDLDHSNNVIGNLQLRQGKHGKGAMFCCGDCGSYNVVSVEL